MSLQSHTSKCAYNVSTYIMYLFKNIYCTYLGLRQPLILYSFADLLWNCILVEGRYFYELLIYFRRMFSKTIQLTQLFFNIIIHSESENSNNNLNKQKLTFFCQLAFVLRHNLLKLFIKNITVIKILKSSKINFFKQVHISL